MLDTLQNFATSHSLLCTKCEPYETFLTMTDFQHHHLEYHECLLPEVVNTMWLNQSNPPWADRSENYSVQQQVQNFNYMTKMRKLIVLKPGVQECTNFNEKHLITAHLNYSSEPPNESIEESIRRIATETQEALLRGSAFVTHYPETPNGYY